MHFSFQSHGFLFCAMNQSHFHLLSIEFLFCENEKWLAFKCEQAIVRTLFLDGNVSLMRLTD